MQDAPARQWHERSAKEFGYIRGLYDYADPASAVGSAEDAFKRPENDFPTARDTVRHDGYETWPSHRDEFIQFAAMLSARTPMFIDQAKATPPPHISSPADLQDHAIDSMRAEISDRFKRWRNLHWVLRYTTDPDNAVTTGDHCIGVDGKAPTLEEAFSHPETTVFFPLSWDMALFGAPVPISPVTARFLSHDLERLREFVFKQAQSFLVATVPLFFK